MLHQFENGFLCEENIRISEQQNFSRGFFSKLIHDACFSRARPKGMQFDLWILDRANGSGWFMDVYVIGRRRILLHPAPIKTRDDSSTGSCCTVLTCLLFA